MAQFELANRIELKNPYINLDYYYGPYLVNAFPEVPDTGLNIDTQQAQRLVFNQAENNVVQPESQTASSLSDLLNAAALKCGYGDGADSAGRTIALAVSSGTKYKVKEYWLNDGKWVEKNKEPQEIDLTGYWKYQDAAFLLEEKLSNGSISKTCYTIQDGEIIETVYREKPGDVLRKLHIDGYLGGDFFLENATIDGNILEFPGTLEDLNALTGYVIYRGDLYRYNIPAQVDFNQAEGTWEISGWEKVTIPNNYVVYVGNNLWIPITPSVTANDGDIITDVKTSTDGIIHVTKKPLEVSEGDIITDISVDNDKIQVTKKPITVDGKGDTVKSVQFDEHGLIIEKDSILDHIPDTDNFGHKILYINNSGAGVACASYKTDTITWTKIFEKNKLSGGSMWSDTAKWIFCYSRNLVLYGDVDLTISNLISTKITVTTTLTQPSGDEETITTTFVDCSLSDTTGNLLGPKSNTDSTQVIVGKYKYTIEQISKNIYNLSVWLYSDENVYTYYTKYNGLNIVPAVNSASKNTIGDSAVIKFEFKVSANNLFTNSDTTIRSQNKNQSLYTGCIFTKQTTGQRDLIKPHILITAENDGYGYIKSITNKYQIDWSDPSTNLYGLRSESDGRGYVTVPAATSTEFGTIKATNNATDDSSGTKYPLKIDASGNGYVTVPAGGGTTVPLYTKTDMTLSTGNQYHLGGSFPSSKALTPEALAFWDGSYMLSTTDSSKHLSNLAWCALGQLQSGAVTDLTRLFKACDFDLVKDENKYIHVAHIERKNNNWEQITLLVQGAHYSTNAQVGLINFSGGKQKVFTLWFPKNQSLYDYSEYDKETDFFNNSIFYLNPADNTTGPWDLYMSLHNGQKAGNHHISVQILSDPDECVTLKMDATTSLPASALSQPKYSIRPTSGSHINVSRRNEISLDNSSVIKNDTAKIADNNYGFIKIAEVEISATVASQGIRGTFLVSSKSGWNDINNAGPAIITWTINQNSSGNSIGVSAVQLPGYDSGKFTTFSSEFFVKSNGDEYNHKIEFYAKKGSQWHSCNVVAFDKYTTIVKSDPGLTDISSVDTLADTAIFYLSSNIGKYKKIPVCVINPGTATTYDGLNSDNFVTERNLKQILAQSSQVNITYGTATTQPTLSESGNKVVTEQNLKQILAQTGSTNITYGTATTRPTLSESGDEVVTEQNLKQIIDQIIPDNNTSNWHRGLFVTQNSDDLTISPQLWSGPALANATFTLLGSRGMGAIGAPESSSTHSGNLCTWANNIEFYSPSSTSTQLGILNITNDGVTYSNKITASSFYESSDKRMKDISDCDLSLDQILSIPLVDFTWKDKRDLKHHLGTIAQDVQEVVPEIVEEDKDGMLTVEYDKFGILAIEAIRQLKDIVDKQAKEIEELKAKIK